MTTLSRKSALALAFLSLLLAFGCGGSTAEPADSAADPAVTGAAEAASQDETAAAEEPLIRRDSEIARELHMDQKWVGDWEGMLERRIIRALVVPGKTAYFLDGLEEKGATYEAFRIFEKWVNEQLGTRTLRVHVVLIPTTRDRIFQQLNEGIGDIAGANLTVTAERQQTVDFADPFIKDVSEVVVTGTSGPTIETVDDLSGQEVYVRTSSSYYESLTALNERFRAEGRPEVRLRVAEEYLEDEDLLQMVDAGLVDVVVVDNHKARFWDQIFDNIVVHENVAVRTGGTIAWAVRKNSPELIEVIDRFVAKHKQGTLMGNIVLNRYLKDTSTLRKAFSTEDRQRYRDTVELFRRHAPEYGFPALLMTAQGYQESRLDQSLRSSRGAIGIMQLLPSTAADKSVGIPNIEEADPNVHAGVRYMRWLRDTYFDDPNMDDLNKTLFALASYNAGPNRIARLRKAAADRGLDPNVWFRNVELLVAEDVGRETVDYVSNIYKYYAAYLLLSEREAASH